MVLVLSPLVVTPNRHGQGIGTALVAAALAGGARLGAPAVVLGGRLGLRRQPGLLRRRGARLRLAVASDPRSGLSRSLRSRRTNAWMTGQLVHYEAFGAHECVGLRDPVRAEIEARVAE